MENPAIVYTLSYHFKPVAVSSAEHKEDILKNVVGPHSLHCVGEKKHFSISLLCSAEEITSYRLIHDRIFILGELLI